MPRWIWLNIFPASAESLHQICPVASLTAPPGRPAEEPETFTVRPFSPADAQEIVRLIYRSYGYSYPYQHLYYPERLIALNADGSILSVVAVSPQDELVGHLAVFFSKENPALAEMGTAVVHPDFRGHGCLRQLTEYVLAEGSKRQLQSFYARPVTNHTYSQKVLEELGFNTSGLLAGFWPAITSFKKIHENLGQRESMLLMYRNLNMTLPAKIYPPARHRDFILQIYAGLGLAPEVAEPGEQFPFPDPTPDKLDINTFPAGIAVIKIKAIGPDTPTEISRNLKTPLSGAFRDHPPVTSICARPPCLIWSRHANLSASFSPVSCRDSTTPIP